MITRGRASRRPVRRTPRGRYSLELSVIFIVSALLFVSIIALVGRVITADGGVDTDKADPYPRLYAETEGAVKKPPSKTIYFTFDDGPSKNTEKILDMLKEEDAKATFFVTAQYEDKDFVAKMLRRMEDEGHTIGLHSYTHGAREVYKSVDTYLSDISRLNDFILEHAGIKPQIIRFPGGSRTVKASKSVMKEIIAETAARGYPYYDWHVVSGDDSASVYSAEYLAKRMLDGVSDLDTAVILCHDNATPKTTAEAVRIVIRELREQGYSFDKLTADIEPIHIK